MQSSSNLGCSSGPGLSNKQVEVDIISLLHSNGNKLKLKTPHGLSTS